MTRYVDGYVIPIAKRQIKAYKRLARIGREVWLDHGALDYMECAGDDLNPPFGLSFPKGIRTKPGETVMFSFAIYRSRAHRDRVNKKVMADPRLAAGCEEGNMLFDPKRMLFGGFKSVLADRRNKKPVKRK